MKIGRIERVAGSREADRITRRERWMMKHPGEMFAAARDAYRAEVAEDLEAASSEERRIELRQKYRRESEALAECALKIYRYLVLCRTPHDFSAEKVAEILSGVTRDYGVTRDSFKDLLSAAKKELVVANRAIQEVFVRYSGEKNLTRSCFQFEPKGKVDILASPIHIHFRFFKNEDYAKAFSSDIAEDNQSARKQAEEEAIYRSTAYAPDWSVVPELMGKIVIERVGKNQSKNFRGMAHIKDRQIAKSNLIHEMLHKLGVLIPGWQIELPEYDPVWEVLRPGIDQGREYLKEHKTDLVLDMVRAHRREIGYDQFGAEEVISFYGEGYTPEGIYEELTRAGGNHDFFIDPAFQKRIVGVSRWANKYWREAMAEAKGGSSDPSKIENIKDIIRRVFQEDYYAVIKNWTDLISTLERKGWTREQIASRLFTTPYTDWLKLDSEAAEH